MLSIKFTLINCTIEYKVLEIFDLKDNIYKKLFREYKYYKIVKMKESIWVIENYSLVINNNKKENYMDLSIAKAIVVKGAGNRGKTSLIFEFIKNLLNVGGEIILPKHYKKLEIINKNNPSDYCMIVKYKGHNVLVMSQGDGIENIKKQLSTFSNENIVIGIVIGAARTRGKTVWWWKDNFPNRINFFHNNEIIGEKKMKEYIKKQLDSLNEVFAMYL